MSTLQDQNNGQLTAAESNPNRLKWMAGFPPKKEKIISAVDGSFFNFPAIRYSVNHMREFFPNRIVEANREKPHKLKIKLNNNIDDLTFIPWSPISSSLSNGEWKSENQFFTYRRFVL